MAVVAAFANDTASLAASLIGTKSLPDGLRRIKDRADEARAYHVLSPYPIYHFQDWKTENRGTLPRCLPIARSIVRRQARWLFGKPLQINLPGNPTLEKELRDAWTQNRMPSRMVAAAEHAGCDGGLVLKFAFDESKTPALTFQTLNVVEEVRLFYHPLDRETLLMARIQFKYFDAAQGKTFWYREEWTDADEVHYHPVADETIRSLRQDPDTFEGWVIDSAATKPNPFGVIPLVHIKNIETDDVWGAGDCWDLFRILDRIHLTFHLMDRSNQFDSEINPIYIDGDIEEADIDQPQQPGEPIAIESKEGQQHQAKVVLPEARGALRPAMMEYAKELKKQVYDATGSVFVDQAEFSNKGNLTTAVLEQLFQPLLEVLDEKKKTYGADGLVRFFATVAKGLAYMGVTDGVSETDEATYTVELGWPAVFKPSEDEKAATTVRTIKQEGQGYLTHQRAIRRIANLEEITDIEALEDEIAVEPPFVPPAVLAAQQIEQDTSKELGADRRIGGPDSQ